MNEMIINNEIELTMEQIPINVIYLTVSTPNMNNNFLKGMERMINLKILKLYTIGTIPFKNLEKLSEIHIYTTPFNNKYKFMNSGLVDNIKHRIIYSDFCQKLGTVKLELRKN